MNWKLVDEALVEAFSVPHLYAGGGRGYGAEQPVILEEVMEQALETEEEREEFEDDPLALLEEQGLVSLLSFHWQSIGPCVFSTFVSLLELGREHVFVIVRDEWVGAKVIARLEPAAEQRLVSAFVHSLIFENGEAYGYHLFGSLPSETFNSRPDLVPRSILQDGYAWWMEWAEANHGPEIWATLEDQVVGPLFNDPYERAMGILKSLPPLDEREAVRTWLEQERSRGAQLPESSRALLLYEYFEHNYEEIPSEGEPPAEE
jgi:hypothetical protein